LGAANPFQVPASVRFRNRAAPSGPDAEVDPLYVPLKDEASREHTHRSHGLLTGRYSFGTIENIPSSGKTYVGTKFRIVVEYQPTTTASPQKALRKRPGVD
jgi:hypothetical protein